MLFRLLILLQLLPVFISAQENDPLERSFCIAYENDLLTAAIDTPTDYYYTGGTFIEFKLPGLRKNPVSKILLTLPNGRDEAFGISYNNLAFTPTSIASDSILYDDRPFAGTLYFGLNRISGNGEKMMRLTSRLDLGVIGPAALGYETQKFIHANTNNPEPHGWQFQILNDAYINYALRLEKGLLATNVFELIGSGTANAGTIYTNAAAGIKIRAGRMDSYFSTPAAGKKFQLWIHASAEGKIIARDATLQGGLLNTGSAYVIASGNMKRTVGVITTGVVISYSRVRLEYSNTFISREFTTGMPHSWGRLGFQLSF